MSRFSSILEQNDVAQVFDLFETYQKNSIYVVCLLYTSPSPRDIR